MNTSPKNEGAIADNEHMKARIPELVYKRLLIPLHPLHPFVMSAGTFHFGVAFPSHLRRSSYRRGGTLKDV